MSRTAVPLWQCGEDRFVVTLGGKAVPLLGYVSQSADKTWRVEHGGKILSVAYSSADDAAKALIKLERKGSR